MVSQALQVVVRYSTLDNGEDLWEDLVTPLLDDLGADVNYADENGYTVLDHFILNSEMDDNKQDYEDGGPVGFKWDILQRFVQRGADPTTISAAGHTLWHAVAHQGYADMIDKLAQMDGMGLLSLLARVSVSSNSSSSSSNGCGTPLHIAAAAGRMPGFFAEAKRDDAWSDYRATLD